MSKEHSYAYEAGYRDGSIHYELEHCPACKNVADLQEALAENVKLRELVDKLLYGINNELTPADALVWTQEANTMLRELGVDE